MPYNVTCKWCSKSFVSNWARSSYCTVECRENFLRTSFVCKKHGSLKDEDKRKCSWKGRIHFICRICTNKENFVKKRQRINPIKCINCSIEFCYIGWPIKWCSYECNIQYLKNNYICKIHGKIEPSFVKTRLTAKKKDSNRYVQSLCKKCINDKPKTDSERARAKIWYREKISLYSEEEKERRKIIAKQVGSYNISNITDVYVKKVLCKGTSLRNGDIPESLIALSREKIKLHRLIKEKSK